jgi:hypothetical protein
MVECKLVDVTFGLLETVELEYWRMVECKLVDVNFIS